MQNKIIEIGDVKRFELIEAKSKYLVKWLDLYFCDDLASQRVPLIFDPNGYGSKPVKPKGIYYRTVRFKNRNSLCFQYFVYWPKQKCGGIRDHIHDYEPIFIFYKISSKHPYMVANNGVGGNVSLHRIEIHADKYGYRDKKDHPGNFQTSPSPYYPFGDSEGQKIKQFYKRYPLMSSLYFKDNHPLFAVCMCYHVFGGQEKYSGLLQTKYIEDNPLELKLRRLDDKVLDKWYLKHHKSKNEEPFGHDVSNPFKFPYIRYFDPKNHPLIKL